MPYVQLAYQSRFHDPLFVYESTEQVTRYCEPDCYAWIESLGKEMELANIRWMELTLPVRTFAPKPVSASFSPSVHLESLLRFPMTDEDTPYLISIYNFFDGWEARKKKTMVERMERAVVSGSYPRVPNTLMERLVSFVIQDAQLETERIRLLMSPIVAPYLSSSVGKGTTQ